MDSGESDSDEDETEESSSTELSEGDEKPAKRTVKKPTPKKRPVIESDSEETEDEAENKEKENKTASKKVEGKKTSKDTEDSESSEEESEHDESGEWEEICVETGKVIDKGEDAEGCGDGNVIDTNVVKAAATKTNKGKRTKADDTTGDKKGEAKKKKVETEEIVEPKDVPAVGSGPELDDKEGKTENVVDKTSENVTDNAESPKKVVSPKKPRGRKAKAASVEGETVTPEVTPKKRGRKPKVSVDAEETGQETQGEEIPVKKKRGRKPKSTEEKVADSGKKKAEDEKTEVHNENEDSSLMADDGSVLNDKSKDDSPLSARNKQNAPVGVVKPEVRQGVIVENKQVTDGRTEDQRPGEPAVNPLQGMRELALGTQSAPGQNQSSFTPYQQPSYGAGANMPPYMNQPGFQNYPGSHYGGPDGQSPRGPYPGPPPPHYPSNQGPQGPMSPNSYQQAGPFMSSMQHGPPPPSYYQQGFRSQMEGFGPPGQQPYQQGPFPPGYPQGHYPGPRPGFGSQMNPYPMGPHSSGPHSQGGPYQQGMPYNYPHLPPQGPQGFGPPHPDMSGGPLRPQSRLPIPVPVPQGLSPGARSEGSSEGGNRGFMMDNILKSSNEVTPIEPDEAEDVSDIDRYTSFLCKDK